MPEAPTALPFDPTARDESRWLKVIETIPQIVWTATADGLVDYANERWHRYTGTPRGASPDLLWIALIHPDDRAPATAAWRDALERGERYQCEYRILGDQDVGYRWFLDRGETIRDAAGRVVRWFGTCTDIHEAKLLEERLRSSEERFRSLVETASLYLWTGDARGSCTYLNENWLDYTGLTLEQALDPATWLSFYHPKDRDRVFRDSLTAIADGREFEVGYRFRRGSDGQYRWFLTRVHPIRDASGAIDQWSGVSFEVHALKESELASIASERQLRHLADSMPQVMWLTDEKGRLRFANRRFAEFTGFDGDAPRQDEPLSQIIHPDDRPLARDAWRHAIESGTVFEIECRGWSKITEEYRWLLSRAVPIRDASGRVVRWLGTSTDIDQQKRTARLLTTETRVLEAMLEDRPLTDLLDVILRNFEEQFEDAVGMVLRCEGDLLFTIAGPSLPGELVAALAGGVPIAEGSGACGTAAHRRRMVAVVDVDSDPLVRDYRDLLVRHGLLACWSTPILLAGDVLYGTFAFYHRRPRRPSARDSELIGLAAHLVRIAIERQRSRDELARKADELALRDRRRSEFLAMLSHELRNPLGSLSVAAELAREGKTRQEQDWAHQIIDRQLKLLTRLIDDLLDISRIDRGKIRICPQVADVAEIVQQAVDATRGAYRERGHSLELDLPAGPVRVLADPSRLVQVLVNLLMNAAKYTDPGGEVTLRLVRDGDGLRIAVQDNGIGIAPEKLEHVFEIFTQLEGTIDRSKGGLGIGLALVKALVEMHGGTVEARSEGLGRGSEFIVRLPAHGEAGLAPSPAPAIPTAPLPEPEAEAAGSLRVLIVEDNDDARTAYTRLLRQAGHDVRAARDGREGLVVARRFRPDVMLVDIGLPRLDGRALLKTLREKDGWDLPAFAMSGYGEEQDVRDSLDAGFQQHLIKPIPSATLLGLFDRLPTRKATEGV